MIAYLLSLNPEANIAHQWDFGFLKDFLDDNEFSIKTVSQLVETDRAMVVIPARHHAGLESEVNQELQKIKHVVLFLMGDEEADFDIDKINHSSIHVWVQNPHMGKHDKYNKLGTGYPTHMKSYLPKEIHKDIDVFFAGQNTHQRRHELVDVMKKIKSKDLKVYLHATKGFTLGETKEEYYTHMCETKVAPCPSGAVIPDSFRLFEALECMAIPIADQKTPDGTEMQYWDWLFGEITPFYRTANWEALWGLTNESTKRYPEKSHEITAWWIMWKRNFKLKVLEQLNG